MSKKHKLYQKEKEYKARLSSDSFPSISLMGSKGEEIAIKPTKLMKRVSALKAPEVFTKELYKQLSLSPLRIEVKSVTVGKFTFYSFEDYGEFSPKELKDILEDSSARKALANYSYLRMALLVLYALQGDDMSLIVDSTDKNSSSRIKAMQDSVLFFQSLEDELKKELERAVKKIVKIRKKEKH